MLNSLVTIAQDDGVSKKSQKQKEVQTKLPSEVQSCFQKQKEVQTKLPSQIHFFFHVGRFIRKRRALSVIRVLILDFPLVILLLLYATTELLLHCNEQYWEPLVNELLPWRNNRMHRKNSEMTYYGRVCNENDQTANSPEEIMISRDMTSDDAVESMLKHGISIFPNLLKPETAADLRETIIEHNHIENNFHVLQPEQRYSYGIRVEQHSSVRQAIHEISTHPVLQPVMKKMIGEHQAVYKFHAITSDYGADDQDFHWDVVPQSSAALFARSFVPIYSLFIPLQNTTADMGSTEICPGTHICTAGTRFCRKTAFRASGQADNWSAGTGALMNQQLTHRGRAHINPDSGPRVLFILAFTPTPRHDHPHQLETRSLSLGGSYATHWTQWGHTEFDLQDSWKRMKMPWKLLRSLGVYKPKDAAWGWDWITSILIQVANDAYYHRDELEEYIEAGGFAPMPNHLLPDMPDERYTRGRAWYTFVIELIENCREYLQKLVRRVLFTYVGLALGCHGYQLLNRQRTGKELAKFSIFTVVRVILMLAIVSGLYYHVSQSIASTPWAAKIRSRKLYQLSHNFRGPHLPNSVLPLEQDVLLMDDMQSEYLASYTRLYDIAHPGNAAWREMVSKNAGGYSNWNNSMRRQLRDRLYLWNRQKQSRILLKNHLNQWAEMTREMADEFVHNLLMSQDIPIINHTLRHWDYLWSETKFGPWRDTQLHETYIPALLNSLKERILGVIDRNETTALKPARSIVPSFRVHTYLAQIPATKQRTTTTCGRNNGIPPIETNISEPFVGAWLRVGDDVEGRYRGEHNEWYRGRIIGASAFDATWTVEYYDGEQDSYLCRYCVRPFRDYQVGEVVEYMATEKDDWHEARIAAVKYDEHYDAVQYDFFHLATDDEVRARYGIIPSDMRRFKPILAQEGHFNLGQQVEARYYDDYEEHDGQWYIGSIVAINEDEDRTTYNVEFWDGSDQLELWEEDLRAL